MTKSIVIKKPSFLKSIFLRMQKRKSYYAVLEREFSKLKIENEQLKKSLAA